MNMFTTVTPADGEALTLGTRFSTRPLWQRAGLFAAPIILLAA